jgi:CheY-like chemotaxis protein
MDLDGIRVMIVEDDFNVARSLASLLESYGAEIVATLPSVAKALAVVETRRFDVAVLDVQLRGETVAAVAERLRAQRIPFVFLTGFRDLEQLPEALRSYPRIDKPADAAMLVRAIRAAAVGR